MAPTTGQRNFFDKAYAGSGPENYERHFVPAIGLPVAGDLVAAAEIRAGDRVLDVACGTGVVARLAAELAGEGGAVTGVDINPGMIAVARGVEAAAPIEWHEANAEKLPFADDSFDVVLSQMGLQFVADKDAAAAEMRRVLRPGGRLAVNVPGVMPPLFRAMADALGKHISPDLAVFAGHVFSFNDPRELTALLERAGFGDVTATTTTKSLRLPPPRDFLWQYVHSTPLAGPVAAADDASRAAVEDDVVTEWARFVEDGVLVLDQDIVVCTARAQEGSA